MGSGPLLEGGVYRFRTLAEGARLAAVLARACPRPDLVAVGLTELFTNAVEHGNLGITYEEKTRLIAERRLAREVEVRQKAPQNRDKAVAVLFERWADEVRITVRDQGGGFDWRRHMGLDPADRSPHGRGIAVARRLSFDHLEYRDPGNEVVCVVRTGAAER